MTIKDIGKLIKIERESRLITQEQLSLSAFPQYKEEPGGAQTKMARIESGGNKLRVNELEAVAAALGLRVRYFLDDDTEFGDASIDRRVPLISFVQAGALSEPVDPWPVGYSGNGDPVATRKAVGPRAFALKVIGDSMAPRYLQGDRIVVDPDVECQSGQPCIASVNGEVTFKVFYRTEKEIRLKPLNDRHPEMVIPLSGSVEFRVIGAVVDMEPELDGGK